MKRFSKSGILGLFALGAVSSGCYGDGDDADAAFQFDWLIQYVQGGEVSCGDAGAGKVDLDVKHVQTGVVSHFSFDCTSLSGLTTKLPLGPYYVTPRLRDIDGRIVSEAETKIWDIHRNGVTSLEVIFDIQSFKLAWTINKNNESSTCAGVGATHVELETRLGEDPIETFKFPCTQQDRRETVAVPIGSYSVRLRLTKEVAGPDGQPVVTVLSSTTPMTFVVLPNVRAVLPPVTFDVK